MMIQGPKKGQVAFFLGPRRAFPEAYLPLVFVGGGGDGSGEGESDCSTEYSAS